MNKKGMTLAEVLISVGIFSMIITGVIGTFLVSIEASKKLNLEYAATNLAKNKIENLRYMEYDLLPEAEETDENFNEDGSHSYDPVGPFIRTTAVAANYSGDSHLTKVVVDVYYLYKGQKNASPASMTAVLSDIR